MLRLAIVDDTPADSAALKELVADFFARNEQAYMLHVFDTPLDFIRSTESHDIVFMDIRMDKLDGIEVARIMRKINTDAVLIFVTHMAQLAIKGYEVDALDFIVKPADQFSINYVLTKALTRLENTSSTVFALKTSDGIVSLSSNDMWRFSITTWLTTPPRACMRCAAVCLMWSRSWIPKGSLCATAPLWSICASCPVPAANTWWWTARRYTSPSPTARRL